jgi:hypothetical protein
MRLHMKLLSLIVFSITVNASAQVLPLAQRIIATPSAQHDTGRSLALNATGTTLLIGANYLTTNSTGLVWQRGTGSFAFQAEVRPPLQSAPFDHGRGEQVALSGETAVAGAPFFPNSAGFSAGTAFVFTRNITTWAAQAQLFGDDGGGNFQANADFASAIAIDGNTIVIGAPRHDTAPFSDSGAVYIYTRSGVNWSQVQRLLPPSPNTTGNFGIAVALEGDYLIIGEPGNLNGSDVASLAYVYQRAGGSFTLAQTLTAQNANSPTEFGLAIAISGSKLLIGAPNEDFVDPERFIGAAYVFNRLVSGLYDAGVQVKAPSAAERQQSARFGAAVALDGNLALIASTNYSTPTLASAGRVFSYAVQGVPSLLQRLESAQPEGFALFGKTVALKNQVAAVAAPGEDGEDADGGAVYVYFDRIFGNGFE